MEVDVIGLLLITGATKSKSEAKRLIKQNAVEIDGVTVGRVADIGDGSVLHCGKSFWRTLRMPKELKEEI